MGKFVLILGRLISTATLLAGSALLVTSMIKVPDSNFSVHEAKLFSIWFYTILVAGNVISFIGKALIETKNEDFYLGYWIVWGSSVLIRIFVIFCIFFITEPAIDMVISNVKKGSF